MLPFPFPLEGEKSVRHRKASISLSSWIAPVGAAVSILLLLILLPFEYNRLMADWYYWRADVFAYRKNWAAVISQAREGYQYYPYRKEFLFAVGKAYVATGEADAAIEATKEFLETYPYDMAAHHNIALAYVRKGNTDLAFQHFDRVFEILPEYGPTHFEVAQLRESKNELDKALEHYRLAVEDEPDNALFLEKLRETALTKELLLEAERLSKER